MRSAVKIREVVFAAGLSAFYFDDQAAIKAGAEHDGFVYRGTPLTTGFRAIRQSGASVSIILKLDDGQTACGDCAAVQYSGAAGRDPLFMAEAAIAVMRERLAPALVGRAVSSFRGNIPWLDSLKDDPDLSHSAILYGLSQALLDAAAKANHCLMSEIVCAEWGLPVIAASLPLFGQSGDDRHAAVDKMILKRVAALPHGLINNIPDKLGHDGEKLHTYVRWLSERICHLRDDSSYSPDLHIDVYGTIGLIFDNDPVRIAAYIAVLEQAARPLRLYIEGPADAGSKDAQMAILASIRTALRQRESTARIVADEWCNTLDDVVSFAAAQCCDMVQIKTPDLGSIHNSIEAVLHCQTHGVEAYLGGTCNETDISARACIHVAMATRPARVLVKPGMGFDEGMTVVGNEMRRIMAVLGAQGGGS